MLDDLRLLVSELVTNSVRHAGQGPEGWVDVRVSTDGRGVRVEVCDPGPGFRQRKRTTAPQADRTSGRGLYLVAQIADRWGVHRDEATRVWFEIDRARRPEAPTEH
jgi:anti-sigma regulatory factor (Ser/Thr protein kinase)